jgi:hypothetical protein
MDEGARKTVAKYLEDMHSLVTHGLQPLEHQQSEPQMKDHPEALRAVQGFHSTFQRHERDIATRLQGLGTSPTTAIQDAASAVAGVVAGLYNRVRTEAVSKSVRDDYTFISHCGIAYMMLMTTARSLGDHDTEELAEQGYRDCAQMAMEIDALMPKLVVQELQHDGLRAQDVSDWARGIIHGAWQRQGAGTAASARR